MTRAAEGTPRRRRVFLDIGAHIGETLAVVRQPRWGFAEIHSFEPAPQCWPALEALADDRVTLWKAGLSDRNGRVDLYDAGSVGASLSADKDGIGHVPTTCDFRSAGDWFEEHFPADQSVEVFAKINVEGAEPEIIESLRSRGQLSRIDHLLIHFDVRKVPARAPLESRTRGWLEVAGIEYVDARAFMHGGVTRGTRNWLVWCGLRRSWQKAGYRWLRMVEGRARAALYPLKLRLQARGGQ